MTKNKIWDGISKPIKSYRVGKYYSMAKSLADKEAKRVGGYVEEVTLWTNNG